MHAEQESARLVGVIGIVGFIVPAVGSVLFAPTWDFPRADATEAIPEAPPISPQLNKATQTVLVVEDEPGLRELAKRLLERQGYTVFVAANADEASRFFDETSAIDVLLTDVVMPGASGPELTQALIGRKPGLHVIYMSGYTEDAIVHHGILAPGIAFLQKPFTSETLGRKIQQILKIMMSASDDDA